MEQKYNTAVANFMINDFKAMIKKRKMKMKNCPIAPEVLGYMCRMVVDGHLEKKDRNRIIENWLDEKP